MYFCLVFLFILLYFQLFMAVLTIYFLVETVYRYHVRTLPRTSIDTPSRSSVSNISSICIRTCRYTGYYVILCIFSLYSRFNPILIHYRCTGTYIISRVLSRVFPCKSVLLHYSPFLCNGNETRIILFPFKCLPVYLHLYRLRSSYLFVRQ
jgi:hypothetical protein